MACFHEYEAGCSLVAGNPGDKAFLGYQFSGERQSKFQILLSNFHGSST
jgi:hypothetical protein